MGVGSFQQFLQFADNPHLSFVQKQGVISLMIIGFYCFGLVVAILIGMIGLWRLRMIQLMPSSYKVIDLLTLAESKRREQASARVKGQPINRAAGIVFFILGVTIFAVIGPPDVFHPLPAFASFGAFLALIKSRQNFQVSANSLLAADQRQPILFLRAFVDDPSLVVRPTLEQVVKLVDFSVETRLANHFMDFGPFIAVGSPREKCRCPAPRACSCRTITGSNGSLNASSLCCCSHVRGCNALGRLGADAGSRGRHDREARPPLSEPSSAKGT